MRASKKIYLALNLFSVLSFVYCLFFPSPDGLVYASLLGVLITGAAVQTTFAGQSQCDEYILLGAVDTANPLTGLSVEIDGTPFINIANSQVLVTAFAKWMMETAGAGVVGIMFKVATGAIKRNTTYRFTNSGAFVPNIFVFSDSQNGIPILATTKGINVSSFEDFSKFSALFLTLPASVSSVEISYNDGHKATMTIAEVDGLFALKNQAEALGRLGGVSVIDNTAGEIQNVRVFAGATAVTVLIAKLPNESFDEMKSLAQKWG